MKRIQHSKGYYESIGFTSEEAARMMTGETIAGAIERQGGYYQVGNISFPQAISAGHAVKLYQLNFEYAGQRVQKMTIKRGVPWVVNE